MENPARQPYRGGEVTVEDLEHRRQMLAVRAEATTQVRHNFWAEVECWSAVES